MPQPVCHLLPIGIVVTLACTSWTESLTPMGQIALGLSPSALGQRDTTRCAELVRLRATADSALDAVRGRQVIPDTGQLTDLRARLPQAMADTAVQQELARAVSDSALLAPVVRELDSLLACPERDIGAR